jgi:hypothetical protein
MEMAFYPSAFGLTASKKKAGKPCHWGRFIFIITMKSQGASGMGSGFLASGEGLSPGNRPSAAFFPTIGALHFSPDFDIFENRPA